MMTEVSKIIQQIARQQFLPDATRSGRFVKVVEKADGGAGTCHDEEAAAEEDDYDGAEGGDSSDASSDGGGPHEECDEVPGSTPLLHFVPILSCVHILWWWILRLWLGGTKRLL